MDNLFLVKDKVIKYQHLVLDKENNDIFTYLNYTFDKNFYPLLDGYLPDENLKVEHLIYDLDDFNKLESQEDVLKDIFKYIEFNKENIGIYMLCTSNVFLDKEDMTYKIGVIFRYTEM